MKRTHRAVTEPGLLSAKAPAGVPAEQIPRRAWETWRDFDVARFSAMLGMVSKAVSNPRPMVPKPARAGVTWLTLELHRFLRSEMEIALLHQFEQSRTFFFGTRLPHNSSWFFFSSGLYHVASHPKTRKAQNTSLTFAWARSTSLLWRSHKEGSRPSNQMSQEETSFVKAAVQAVLVSLCTCAWRGYICKHHVWLFKCVYIYT